MIEIRPRELVILASDYSKLLAWYQEALGFQITADFTEDYKYCNLETPSGIQIGIGDAAEMGVEPIDRSTHTVIPQIEVDDVKEFFKHLEKSDATITFGPSFDENGKFWYGGFADPEGNPFWVVDLNTP